MELGRENGKERVCRLGRTGLGGYAERCGLGERDGGKGRCGIGEGMGVLFGVITEFEFLL